MHVRIIAHPTIWHDIRSSMPRQIDDMSELGRIVRYHRKRAGLSRAALSELSGVGSTVIYELEHGKPTVQFDILQRVLKALNLQLLVDGPLLDEYVSKAGETR